MAILTKVVPFGAATDSSFRLNFTAWLTKALDAWHATQLSHYGGKYSIERMLALEEYSRMTSLTRILLVILSLPAAVFVVVICQEAVPLKDPREGWQANYGFWVRVSFIGIAASYAVLTQIGLLLDAPPLSLKQKIAYCIGCGVAYVVMGMILTSVSVFPVPFFVLSQSVMAGLVLATILRLVLDTDARGRMREKWLQFYKLAMMNGVMCAGYPLYQVLFTKANHTPYELPVLLILPMMKFILKRIFLSEAVRMEKEDAIPEQVVFTVNFFDTLYLVTCMQTISPPTMMVIMAVDLIHSATSLFSLHERTHEIASNLREVFGADAPIADVLDSVRTLCNHPQKFYSQIHPDIRIRSCVYHHLSAESTELLEKLEKHILYSSSYQRYHVISQGKLPQARAKRKSMTAIQPGVKSKQTFIHSKTVALVAGIASESAEAAGQAQGLVLHEALEALFTSECLVLAEYVEFIVPVLYAAFMLTMVHLPSARYHSEMAGVTLDNVDRSVSGICAYALLEFASFAALAVITKRNCGIRALYQLAFVLETQWSLVFSKIILWTLLTLTYRVVHFGADFSFRFQWIHHHDG